MMTQNGPGGRGSIPALVMRTGLISPMSPEAARRDLDTRRVLDMTTAPGHMPPAFGPTPTVTPVLPSPPSPVTTAVAQTTVAVPPAPIQQTLPSAPPFAHSARQHWHLSHRRKHPMAVDVHRLHPKAAGLRDGSDVELGEWQGRPLAKFEIATQPPTGDAHAAARALRRAAQVLRQTGLSHLPPEMVAGPLAALMRGGAVELHFQNGVVVRTAL